MEKVLAIVALLSFAAKFSTNVIFLEEAESTFATYDTDLTPVNSPLLLCRAFFSLTYSLIMVLYSIATIFRKRSAPNITSSGFFAAFTWSCILEAIYAVLWAYGKTVFAFAFLSMASLCQYIALYYAYTGLYHAKANDNELEASTIWCNRVLVQSALIFDCAWNTVLVILTFAVVLCYSLGVASFQASLIGLVVFGIGLIIWFVVENLVIEKYVRFTIAEYIAISVALTSLLSRDRVSVSFFPILLLSLMAVVLILLFLRVFLIICMENRRKNQDRSYTMVSL